MDKFDNKDNLESIATCIAKGQKPRQYGPYLIKVGNADLKFQEVLIDDPVPTGRQVLEKSGLVPAKEYLLSAWLNDGGIDMIRLDETVDLFHKGVEKFIAFHSDRSFFFELNDRRIAWGAPAIQGKVLKTLARVDTATHGVWLAQRDQVDRLISDDESVSLTAKTIERFHTAPTILLCIEDKEHPWPKNTITTEEIANLGGWDPSNGVIEIDENQNERQLSRGEVVTLKPGFFYAKKISWKRG